MFPWLLLIAVAQANAAPPTGGRHGSAANPDCGAIEGAAFSTLPMLLPAGRGDRGGASYCLTNLRATDVEVRNGKGGLQEPDKATVEDGGFKVGTAGVGNYHWLQASEDSAAGRFTASTAHYFANPGPAPTAMLLVSKADLEIVPQPLPREHWRYRAGETWRFLVRFKGRPLADTGLRLETSGGTQQVLKTDANGLVKVTFPDDVKAPTRHGASGHANHGRGPENRFVLAVGLTEPGGRYHLTGFNHSYGEAYDAGRSLPMGLGFLALGGLLATPLTFRRKEKNHG